MLRRLHCTLGLLLVTACAESSSVAGNDATGGDGGSGAQASGGTSGGGESAGGNANAGSAGVAAGGTAGTATAGTAGTGGTAGSSGAAGTGTGGAGAATGTDAESCPGALLVLTGSPNPTITIQGVTTGRVDDGKHGCGDSGPGASDAVYAFVSPINGSATASVAPQSDWDAIIAARSDCANVGSELDCTDLRPDGSPESAVFDVVSGGTYYVWIDGYDVLDNGLFELKIDIDP